MVLGFNKQFVPLIVSGTKIHTLRDDEQGRWTPGRVMQMATGVRTKAYKCFKEDSCKSTQRTELLYNTDNDYQPKGLTVWVDGRKLNKKVMKDFIKKDGFKNEADFIAWFFPKGGDRINKVLIHWTDMRY